MATMKTTNTGKFIFDHRRRLGHSQAVIAACLNCTVVFVSNVEMGKCLLPPEHAEKLAKVLRVPKAQLINCLRADMREKIERKLK